MEKGMEKGKKNAEAKVGNEASSPRAGALQSALYLLSA